jgi:hypothetical protein
MNKQTNARLDAFERDARPIPPEPWKGCARFAAAYAAALVDWRLQVSATPHMRRDARTWLYLELAHVVARGFWPDLVGREVELAEAVAAFSSRCYGEAVTMVPITSLHNNDPHPVWSQKENLLFRFVHDYHHAVTGADDTFAGELAVTSHILTAKVRSNVPLAHFLASEIAGQAAYMLQTGAYPQQIIARNILDLI